MSVLTEEAFCCLNTEMGKVLVHRKGGEEEESTNRSGNAHNFNQLVDVVDDFLCERRNVDSSRQTLKVPLV